MSPVDTQQTWTQARALHARTVLKYGKNSPEAAETLANFKACRLADHVKDVLAEAPGRVVAIVGDRAVVGL
jgi:hypothetical protein